MSTDSLKQAELNQVKNLEEKTGKKITEWIKIANGSGFEKHGEILSFLKTTYDIGHGYANLVVHYAKQSHAGAESNETDWISEQYKGKEEIKNWYDKLMKSVGTLGKDIEISPKKAYVSLRRKKQFAILQPSAKTRLDVGLNIKGLAPVGKLEASGSWNAMCTHRIKVEDATGINDELIGWIKQAYDQAG
jgi:predicted transport protein